MLFVTLILVFLYIVARLCLTEVQRARVCA